MKISFKQIEQSRIIDMVALVVGIAAACFLCLAYFVIGTNSYVEFHDQLDGEVINYIYQAKYLFSGSDIIPEFMNGMFKSSMTVPAPLGVLFYLFLPPFYAFAFMHLFILIVGYIGFYLLLKKITQNPIISMIVSCLFIYLPFYPVYGLSILGQPLLIWSLWQIYDSEKLKIRHLLCVFLYTICSSLALIGYAWIVILGLFLLLLFIMKKPYKRLLSAFFVMVVTYMSTNVDLIRSVFGTDSVLHPIHREEMVIYPITDIFGYFKEVFLKGVSYAFSYNMLITILAIFIIFLYPIIKKYVLKERLDKLYFLLLGIFSANVIISILATLWHTELVISWRNSLGGFIKYFQLDRITWILPMCWYIILAICITIFINEIRIRFVGYIMALVVLCMVGNTVCENSTISHNLRLMLFPNTYTMLGWDDYYAPDVYRQIDEFIAEEKSSYRTVSLGLPPAAALYNGFYCLDGYSNFYSLEYKHQFRKIISKELDKQDDVKQYFDQWGNRCYLLNAETGNYMMIDKNNNGVYENLEFDTNQLKKMGAKYIFAGMQIANAKELGLELMREQPFSTESSYFKVWLYKICE